MMESKAERVRSLAALVGIGIADAEADEIYERLDSLVQELEQLRELDLRNVQPVCIFPDDVANEQ